MGIVAGSTAFVALLCLFAFTRSARKGSIGVVARLILIAIVAGATWIGRDFFGSDNARSGGRLTRGSLNSPHALSRLAWRWPASMPLPVRPSNLSCEKAVFATPEATAVAASYVAAQLTLLADVSDYARRSGSDLPALANLRHAVELDRFGLAARVLAVRDGCTAQKCRGPRAPRQSGRVKANLDAGTYDLYVMRHLLALAGGSRVRQARRRPTAAALGVARDPDSTRPRATRTYRRRRVGPCRMPLAKLFFPSSESIPAINIMNAEPNAPAGSGEQSKTSAVRAATPTPPRKPAANSTATAHPAPPARQQPPQQRPPVDLNAGGPPAARRQPLAAEDKLRFRMVCAVACYDLATLRLAVRRVALHLIKLCVGTDSIEDLEDWIQSSSERKKRGVKKPSTSTPPAWCPSAPRKSSAAARSTG